METVGPPFPRPATPPTMAAERPFRPSDGARAAPIRVVDVPRPKADAQVPVDATVGSIVAALHGPFLVLHGPVPAVRVVVTVRPAVVPPIVESGVRRLRGLVSPVLQRARTEPAIPSLAAAVVVLTHRVRPSTGALRARRTVHGRTATAGSGVAGAVAAPVAVRPRMPHLRAARNEFAWIRSLRCCACSTSYSITHNLPGLRCHCRGG